MSQPNSASEELQPASDRGMKTSVRHVTTHREDGKSVFLSLPELVYRDRGGYSISRNFAISKVPSTMDGDMDVQQYVSSDTESVNSYVHGGARVVVPDGLNFVTVNLGPNARTAMHRTISIDFVTVTEGEIQLDLDSGESQILKSGDTVTQRATMHQWINPSKTKPARFTAVVAAAVPHEIAGEMLEQKYHPKLPVFD